MDRGKKILQMALGNNSTVTAEDKSLSDKTVEESEHRGVDLLNDDLAMSESEDASDSADEYVPSDHVSSSSSRSMSEFLGNQDDGQSIENEPPANSIQSILPDGQTRKRNKKGQAEPNKWKTNIRKGNRQHGLPYKSTGGKYVPGKILSTKVCTDKCKKKCNDYFNYDLRLSIFNKYWKIDTLEQKRQYILSLVNSGLTKHKQTANLNSRRKFSRKYFFTNLNGEKVEVCQKFFLGTLSITETFLRYCFKKTDKTNIVDIDLRGRHVPHNKKDEVVKKHIIEHINSFPRVPSHYTRKDTRREYLEHSLNVSKMYDLYKIWCQEKNIEPQKISFYRHIITTCFNISFHKPRKDMCDNCFIYQHMSEEEQRGSHKEYEEHIKRKLSARSHRDKAKEMATKGDIYFVEVDLEAACSCPSTSAKQIYYKRRLGIYNFTMLHFEKNKSEVYCYCWHEGIAKKGSIEMGSAIYQYIINHNHGKEITIMSDTCGGQNRNVNLAALFLYCVEKFNIPVINQKYFEPGHSQMEVDNVHAVIEHAKKNVEIFHPASFYAILKSASRKKPFNVIEMDIDDFLNIAALRKILIKNKVIDTEGNRVNWLKIRHIQFRKDTPGLIYFKYDLDEETFKSIQVIRRGRRDSINDIIIQKAYHGPHTISLEKYNDLQSLCEMGIIRPQYHTFYQSLKASNASIINDSDED